MNARTTTKRRQHKTAPNAAAAPFTLAPPVTHVMTGPIVFTAHQFEPPQIGQPILREGFITQTGFLIS